MKQTKFITSGTCSQAITFELDDEHRIHHVEFEGGCPGNTIGVARLVEGQKAEDVIVQLRGVRCGLKSTSCPDQLARALEQALANA